MALTGFSKSCTKRSGGIRSICLIEAENIGRAVYDSSTDLYTALTTVAGSAFRKYEFLEDAASFTESLNTDSGSYSVTHRLTFSMGKFDASSRRAVEELLSASYGGIVAVITTACGDSFVAGYSQEFAAERPLRLTAGGGRTGEKLKDATLHHVTLSAEDTAFARGFTGSISAE